MEKQTGGLEKYFENNFFKLRLIIIEDCQPLFFWDIRTQVALMILFMLRNLWVMWAATYQRQTWMMKKNLVLKISV